MACVADVVGALHALAPVALAEEWDNVGLLVGDAARPVTSVRVALDAREWVLADAARNGCQLVLTHHPVLFSPLSRLVGASAPERVVIAAVEQRIAIVAAHTNLDSAARGLNDQLAAMLGMHDPRPLVPSTVDPAVGLGRVGEIAPTPLAELARGLGPMIGTGPCTHYGDSARVVRTVACCTGSGRSFIDAARAAGADLYVTGDLTYHDSDRAEDMALIDAPHGATETAALVAWLPTLQRALAPLGVTATMAPDTTDPWRRAA